MKTSTPRSEAALPALVEALAFVGTARDRGREVATEARPVFAKVFPGTQGAVRDVLAKAMRFLRQLGIGQDAAGPIELVLAEVINNIVEHAYLEGHAGTGKLIELHIRFEDGLFHVEILDEGLPMPGGVLPRGQQHDLNCETSDMPEGGFGWFLIREFSQSLDYERFGNRNRLRLVIDPAHMTN